MKHTPNHPFEIPVAVVERFENSFAQFELCDNNILVIRLDDNLSFDGENSIVFMEAVKKIANGKQLKMLMLIGSHTIPDNASRAYFALPEHQKYISKCAAVLNSMAQRIVGNFFLRINNPPMPTLLFSDPVEGWNWLIGERGEKG